MAPPGSVSARFEEHVGELKLALEAGTLEDLFTEAARVVSRECGPVQGEPGEWESVSLTARDAATLLADWLNELIGRSEVGNLAYEEVRNLALEGGDARGGGSPPDGGVTPDDLGAPRHEAARRGLTLRAEIRGRPVRLWESALKAATYHGLRLERKGDRWEAEVLFDV